MRDDRETALTNLDAKDEGFPVEYAALQHFIRGVDFVIFQLVEQTEANNG